MFALRNADVTVAAGAREVVRVVARGRWPAGAPPQLAVDAAGAGVLTAGVERWDGRRVRRRLMEWHVPVTASRTCHPGLRMLRLWLVDAGGGHRSAELTVGVAITPGYEVVGWGDDDVAVRNRTATTWWREEVVLVPDDDPARAIEMDQATVLSGGQAVFRLPPSAAQAPLTLVHRRMGRYRPAPLAPPARRAWRGAGGPRRRTSRILASWGPRRGSGPRS
jgi:hypothetical protein